MHGSGNDFLISQLESGFLERLERLVAGLCHRHFGVGADGCIVVEQTGPGRVRMHYWNADGSKAAFCANGARCAARFAGELWGWREVALETESAVIEARVDGAMVSLRVPAPAQVGSWRDYEAGGQVVCGRFVELGVPHVVVPVAWPDFWHRDLSPLAPFLRSHAELPSEGANVHFVKVVSSDAIEVRSWERGVEGETLSCGSGVMAAALVAGEKGWVNSCVSVATASGRELQVVTARPPFAGPATLTGPAERIADITLCDEAIRAFSASGKHV
jgi:diaminopimelate epimerase